MAKQNFDDWMDSQYDTPLDILLDFLPDLQASAAEANASIDAETLSKLNNTHFKNAKSFYLKDRRGRSNSKQWARIVMGTTGKDTPIPIVLFRTYSNKHGNDSTFSPARLLWDRFKRRHFSSSASPKRSNTSYRESIQVTDHEKALLRDEEAALTRSAHQAALIAIGKIETHSEQCSTLPSVFHGHNIPENAHGYARIVTRMVEARLYSRNRSEWLTIKIAQPRDIAIPIYDLRTGEVVNSQVIPANRNGSKRFIAGAPIIGKTALLIDNDPNWENNDWVVCEGYKTGAAIKALEHCNIAPALAANNTPHIVKLLKELYPDKKVYIANDNDPDGRKYRKQAVELGAIPIYEPDLFESCDWADVSKELGTQRTMEMWERNKSLYR